MYVSGVCCRYVHFPHGHSFCFIRQNVHTIYLSNIIHTKTGVVIQTGIIIHVLLGTVRRSVVIQIGILDYW